MQKALLALTKPRLLPQVHLNPLRSCLEPGGWMLSAIEADQSEKAEGGGRVISAKMETHNKLLLLPLPLSRPHQELPVTHFGNSTPCPPPPISPQKPSLPQAEGDDNRELGSRNHLREIRQRPEGERSRHLQGKRAEPPRETSMGCGSQTPLLFPPPHRKKGTSEDGRLPWCGNPSGEAHGGQEPLPTSCTPCPNPATPIGEASHPLDLTLASAELRDNKG